MQQRISISTVTGTQSCYRSISGRMYSTARHSNELIRVQTHRTTILVAARHLVTSGCSDHRISTIGVPACTSTRSRNSDKMLDTE